MAHRPTRYSSLAHNVTIRFAGYQLDPAARTLKYEERQIPLGPKTFDLLFFLASHPHQVVTKEQLLTAVWPDSFVEESNLSQHVFLLRKALANNGQTDKIVVTIPGKGYQFAATVEKAPRQLANNGQGELVLHAVQSVTRLVVEEESDDEASAWHLLPDTHKRRLLLIWGSIGIAGLLLLAASILGWRWTHPVRGEHVDLVLAEFENTTGDADFDRVLNRALTIDLEQSPFLNLLTRSRIGETLMQMQQPKDSTLTPALSREICERNNAQAMLHGTIARLASRYVLILDADSCVSGKQIAGYKAEAGSKEGVLSALDEAAGRVRMQLGESSTSLERFQKPIAQATTASLDALRAYTQALDAADRGDTAAEQALFKRAIALDPNFASAYKELGISVHNRGDFVQGASLIQKAYDLRDHTTERERMSIEIAYNVYATADYEAAINSMRLYNSIYPNNASIWFELSKTYYWLGQTQDAVEAGEYGYRLAPHSGSGAEILANAYMRANRFADAKRVAEAAIAEGKDRWGVHSLLFKMAFAEHDAARLKTEGEWGFTHAQTGQPLTDLGFVAASSGKLREAVDDFTRARQEGLRRGDTDFADDATMFLAGIYIDYGYPAEATATLNKMQSDAIDEGTTAYFREDLGDLGPAQRMIAKMDGSGTKSTLDLYFNLPELRALLALKNHRPADAVKELDPARKYQMRDIGVPFQRARAEIEAGMLDQAAQDYRLILDNPGNCPIWPEHTISHLRLARVLALEKKTDEARSEYRAFFDAWKDADPGLKILADAKREFAQLQ